MSAPIAILCNGEPLELPAGSTVADLLGRHGLKPEQVAVERNKAIVRRADYAATQLAEGDAVEVVTFLGGG